MPKPTPSSLRIIGGQWRSRKIAFSEAPGLRPTGDRVRETVFNWLAPYLPGAACLDLFAGSGALCLEALSRHAKSAIAIDSNSQAIQHLNAAKTTLQAENLSIIHTDALKCLNQMSADGKAFDIVFIDPPFGDKLTQTVVDALAQSACLKPGSLIYIEQDKKQPCPHFPDHWEIIKNKTTGNIAYRLCQLAE